MLQRNDPSIKIRPSDVGLWIECFIYCECIYRISYCGCVREIEWRELKWRFLISLENSSRTRLISGLVQTYKCFQSSGALKHRGKILEPISHFSFTCIVLSCRWIIFEYMQCRYGFFWITRPSVYVSTTDRFDGAIPNRCSKYSSRMSFLSVSWRKVFISEVMGCLLYVKPLQLPAG